MADASRPGVLRVDPRSVVVPLTPVDDRDDGPRAGAVQVGDVDEMAVGVWDHTVGSSWDVEADEVFVVISGSVTVVEEGHGETRFGPSDIGILRAGARTEWIVHEPLRKVWITRGDGRDG
jgi:uncharacterized cupin superfamily protein